MDVGAQLSTTEMRQAARYPVSYRAPGEHRQSGSVHLQIVNVSRSGFLVLERMAFARGDRVMIAPPEAGHIEAFTFGHTTSRPVFSSNGQSSR